MLPAQTGSKLKVLEKSNSAGAINSLISIIARAWNLHENAIHYSGKERILCLEINISAKCTFNFPIEGVAFGGATWGCSH